MNCIDFEKAKEVLNSMDMPQTSTDIILKELIKN